MTWSHRIVEFHGRPAQILIDSRFADAQTRRGLSRLAWLAVYTERDPGSAFWHPDESAVLDRIQDEFIRLCQFHSSGYAEYVLRIATRGIREYYVYFSGEFDLSAVAASLRDEFATYKIEHETTSDTSWNRYLSCLPSN